MSATTRSTAGRQILAGTDLLDAGRGRARRHDRRTVARRRPASRPQQLGPWLASRPAVRGGWARPAVSPVGDPALTGGQPGLRLSLRGRRAVAASAAVVVLWLVGAALSALVPLVAGALPAGAGDTAPGASMVVRAGDTLWAVAARTSPGEDPRKVIAELQSLNDLPGGQVRAGQLLVLPAA